MDRNNIKRVREKNRTVAHKGEVSHTHLATKWTVAPCCTAKKRRSPKKRPKEKKPQECLQTACTAVSSSIAVNSKPIESVQPELGWTIFVILKRVGEFAEHRNVLFRIFEKDGLGCTEKHGNP